MKLPVAQRLAKIRNLHNLDDQYYYDDNDVGLVQGGRHGEE